MDVREPVTALFAFALLTVLLLPLLVAAGRLAEARARIAARRVRWRPQAIAHPRDRSGLPASP